MPALHYCVCFCASVHWASHPATQPPSQGTLVVNKYVGLHRYVPDIKYFGCLCLDVSGETVLPLDRCKKVSALSKMGELWS